MVIFMYSLVLGILSEDRHVGFDSCRFEDATLLWHHWSPYSCDLLWQTFYGHYTLICSRICCRVWPLWWQTSISSVKETFWQSAWLFIFKFMFCCDNCQLCFQNKIHVTVRGIAGFVFCLFLSKQVSQLYLVKSV